MWAGKIILLSKLIKKYFDHKKTENGDIHNREGMPQKIYISVLQRNIKKSFSDVDTFIAKNLL